MAVRGRVKKGKVLLNKPSAIADGTEVEVRPVKKSRKTPASTAKRKRPRRSFADRYAQFIGSVKDLPADMSANHDHYLYGHSKRA